MTNFRYIIMTSSCVCGVFVCAGFSQLMMHTDTNEENLTIFLKLLDNALQHEVRHWVAGTLIIVSRRVAVM